VQADDPVADGGKMTGEVAAGKAFDAGDEYPAQGKLATDN
jgi:hypothetical protein